MKKPLCVLLFSLVACQAVAQSDYYLVFRFPQGLVIGGDNYYEMTLDANRGTRFLALNGVMTSAGGSAPATGTCFFTNQGGAFCNLQVDQNSHTMNLGPSLTGTMTVRDPQGNNIASAYVELISSE